MNEQNRTVLFVDDEVDILNSIKRQLRKSEFSVICTDSSSEALEILKDNDIQIIITDENMPEMKGVELLQKVKDMYPDIVRIILSGFTDSETLIRSINHGEIYRFISKPWDKEELSGIIKDGFAYYYTRQSTKVYMKRLIDENISMMKKLELNESTIEINLDVLNMIPQPIIAVSEDGRAALLNDESLDFFDNAIKQGVRIDEFLQEPAASLIMSGLDLPGGHTSFEIEYQDEIIRVYTKSLKHHSSYKGLIFFENHCT